MLPSDRVCRAAGVCVGDLRALARKHGLSPEGDLRLAALERDTIAAADYVRTAVASAIEAETERTQPGLFEQTTAPNAGR